MEEHEMDPEQRMELNSMEELLLETELRTFVCMAVPIISAVCGCVFICIPLLSFFSLQICVLWPKSASWSIP
jgi:hypothetical protein